MPVISWIVLICMDRNRSTITRMFLRVIKQIKLMDFQKKLKEYSKYYILLLQIIV